MFERVLLAYDGSPAAVAGLSLARRVSHACGSEVAVAHLLEPDRAADETTADRPRAQPESPALTPVIVEEGAGLVEAARDEAVRAAECPVFVVKDRS